LPLARNSSGARLELCRLTVVTAWGVRFAKRRLEERASRSRHREPIVDSASTPRSVSVLVKP